MLRYKSHLTQLLSQPLKGKNYRRSPQSSQTKPATLTRHGGFVSRSLQFPFAHILQISPVDCDTCETLNSLHIHFQSSRAFSYPQICLLFCQSHSLRICPDSLGAFCFELWYNMFTRRNISPKDANQVDSDLLHLKTKNESDIF